MLTYRGLPIRRIQTAYRLGSSVSVLVETNDGRSRVTSINRIGSDHGMDEILHVLRTKAGLILDSVSE